LVEGTQRVLRALPLQAWLPRGQRIEDEGRRTVRRRTCPTATDSRLHASAEGIRAADLDEAFLLERSIDIDTYDRHAEKLREELTLARIDRHSGQLEELDVEGILARSNSASGCNTCFFQMEFRSTETALFEPP
jgi:hypothetical protein